MIHVEKKLGYVIQTCKFFRCTSKHYWGGGERLCDHSITSRIFTLTINLTLRQTLKSISEVAMGIMWTC